MASSLPSETETVIKKILPYLRRRGYDPETDVQFESPTKNPDRYAKGYVDLLVTGGKSKPDFLIEAKRSSKRLSAKDRDQALTYGRAQKVLFVIVTNGTDIHAYNTATGKPIKWNGKLVEKIPTKSQLKSVLLALKADKNAVDVPLSGDESLPFRPGLALKQLNALFARIHNTIRKIEKNEEHSFADFSKILFLKLLEEKADTSDFKLPYSYRFHELAERPVTESDQLKDAILGMIAKIKEKTTYGDVLEDPIHLKQPRTFRSIVVELSAVSFHDSSLDTKGAAFEYFVRATLKGKKLGQYFTPRPLVELMSALVGRAKIANSLLAGSPVKVLDPACGTGGFLVYLMKENLAALAERLAKKQITKKAHDELEQRIMRDVFYGSDANEGVACAAKMNMIIAGDGHTNIRAEDSLASAAKNWNVGSPDCDLILTNPPFGTSEAESLEKHDLEQYPIRSTKGQILFLQKMVLATRGGGEICTVIDEGVLNTESAAALRRWLFEKCEVIAVVRLPEETFKPNKINVRSSLLYLRRREEDDVDLEASYKVTFCNLTSLGYVGSGDRIRGFNFGKLISEFDSKVLDQASGNPRDGYEWSAFDTEAQDILADGSVRLDYKYWHPDVRSRIADIEKAGGLRIRDLNTIKTARGKSPPADVYVDENEGHALVVKAGSNISRFGELVAEGDFVEKSLFEEYVEQKAAHIVQRGDVLLASTGDGTLGKCCVYDSDKPGVAESHVTIIRVDPEIIAPEYLCDYLRAGFGARQIVRLFTGSTGLIELTPDHVDSIVVDLLSGVPAQRALSISLRSKESEFRKAVATAESDIAAAFLTIFP
jgi:type I restriction enzyme M protein